MPHLLIGLHALALAMTGAQSEPEDDWLYAANPAQRLSEASISYETGLTLSAQCNADALVIGIIGLPEGASSIRRFERHGSDGATTSTYWRPTADGNGITNHTPFLARSLREGGRFDLSGERDDAAPVRIAIDLPGQSRNLDRVLTDCGVPLVDPFGDTQDIGDLLVRAPRLEIPESAARRHGYIQISVMCLIAQERLTSCYSPWQQPGDRAAGDALARSANGQRIQTRDPVAAEGRSLELIITGNRIRRSPSR